MDLPKHPRSREAFQRAVAELYEGMVPHFSDGNARVRPGVTGASHPDRDAGLEGFARLLWGVAPLAAGGYPFDDWERLRSGLVNGCDPEHPEHWGEAEDYSQKLVEMAPVGVALALAPEQLWEPLDGEERRLVASWLGRTNEVRLHDCNWLFFRVLTNLGLRAVGADHDPERVRDDLKRLDSYYLGDGWYADGKDGSTGPRDYYVAWEMHVDGLLHAELSEGEGTAERRERARAFATSYLDWFDADGRGLPYGRSLTYRFAQAAFWGALAFADERPDALSWGEIRGLWARNVRWWLDQPVFTEGALSVGYRYPNLKAAEAYNSPASPYWALKAALPLALPPEHPFWRAEEEPMPERPETVAQPAANAVVCRDGSGHHYALAAGQRGIAEGYSTAREKYNKFAYSTAFGVGLANRELGLRGAGHDSALVLSEDGRHYRMREEVSEPSVSDGVAYSRWGPFEGVDVETWLVPSPPWHVRVHRIETRETLHTAEGGFALDRTGDHDPDAHEHRTNGGRAAARYPAGASVIEDLLEDRDASVVDQDPNVNLLHQRTVVPTLTGTVSPGESWRCAAVAATPDAESGVPKISPTVAVEDDAFTVIDGDGERVYRGER